MILAIPFYGFESPQRLWILSIVPVVITAYIIIVLRRSHQGMRYTNTTMLGEVMTKQSQWLRHVIVTTSILSLLALGLAWAQPMGREQVPRERATVVMVIDASLSMEAIDVPPSRLEAAKVAALDFVSKLPQSYNIAVVSLTGNSGIKLAPTDNRAAVQMAIKALKPQESSAVGAAIEAAIVAVSQAPQGNDDSVAPAMIVMLSDGGDTHEYWHSPRVAAQQAATQEIPIFTICFGTDNGYVDIDGQRYQVAPDHELMQDIARITGGEAYLADNIRQLDNAYTRIHSEVGYEWIQKQVTATAAGFSLILAFIAAVGAIIMGVRLR